MGRILVLTLLCCTAFAAAQAYDAMNYGTPRPPVAPRSCPVGQVWDTCPGACMEPKCDDQGNVACAELMKCPPPACQCDRKQGYARDPSGNCIKRSSCPAWTVNKCMTVKCSAGFNCEPTTGRCVKEQTPVQLNPCAATTCLVGSICVDDNGRGKCVAPPGADSNCTIANERWVQCGTCERTCENKLPFCNRMCQPARCMCGEGYFRNKAGECVTENECDIEAQSQKCSENEQFNECSSMCEPQCGQYEPMACILMCGPPKCQCKQGFYRNTAGKCVPRADCVKPNQPACKKNQVFSQCSTMCPPKCGEYGVRACMAMCGPPKCECAPGFYTDNKGECMSRAECDKQSGTPQCKKNEKFSECSTTCEEKCGEWIPTRACPAVCGPPKCECEVGFFRNKQGECVTRTECEKASPPQCKRNEVLNGCGNLCEGKCGDYSEFRACPLICAPAACMCAQGFYRNDKGDCVSRTECEKPAPSQCKPNEIFNSCGSICEPKCGQYDEPRICPAVCAPAACMCSPGFYRNKYGDCVGRSDCELEEQISITCANIDCRDGHLCQMRNGEPTCLPANSLTCATFQCSDGYRCEMAGDRPTCKLGNPLTCNTVKCAGGHRCEILADGKPTCIPEKKPSITCANVRCAGPCTDTPQGPVCGPRPNGE